MTHNAPSAEERCASWLVLLREFVVPMLGLPERRELIAKRGLMEEAVRQASSDSGARWEPIGLLCDLLRSVPLDALPADLVETDDNQRDAEGASRALKLRSRPRN